MTRFTLVLMIATLSVCSGCKGSGAAVLAVRDPECKVTLDSKFAVHIPEDASLLRRQFSAFLAEQMVANGLQVVDFKDSDYLLLCSTSEQSSTVQSTRTVTLPQAGFGTLNGAQYWHTGYSTAVIPTVEIMNLRSIHLDAFRSADVRAGRARTIWEGGICGDGDKHRKDPTKLVTTLLSFLGRSHDGRSRLVRGPLRKKVTAPDAAPRREDMHTSDF